MSIDRTIEIKLATHHSTFSEFIENFINIDFTFNEDGTVTSLKEDDIDDFNLLPFKTFDEVKVILNKRENNNLINAILLWSTELNDSLIFLTTKLESKQKDNKNNYQLNISLGQGKRIVGADRYTDFGSYLNKIIPRILELNCTISEIVCRDIES